LILVTGGAGFVGSHLVDALVSAGHRVRVLDSLESQVHGDGAAWPAYVNEAADLVWGDVRDRATLARALSDVEVVFHQAAAVGVGQSMYEMERYVSANSLGAAVLLEEVVARRDRIRRLVVASSMSLYGEGAYQTEAGEAVFPGPRRSEDLAAARYEPVGAGGERLRPMATSEEKPLHPTSVYAITKRDHEELFLAVGAAYGIPTVALRYFNVYGPRQALSNPYTGVMAIFSARLLNRRRPLIFEDGLQSRDFVHVSDVVQANLLALAREEAAGGVYNVGTGRPTTVLRVAEMLAEHLDFPEAPDVAGQYRAGDIRHCFADISRIRRELGFQPKVALEEGMQGLLAWIRTQSAADGVEAAARELVSRGLAR
jgi:dTDP-L-rhamnose 4-epimerase